MAVVRHAVLFLVLTGSVLLAGINWKAVWLEKPGGPVFLEPGATQNYLVMGLHGGDGKADLTRNPYLKMVSLDPNVVEVDLENTRFVGKSPGTTEIHISFSEITSVVKATVRRSK